MGSWHPCKVGYTENLLVILNINIDYENNVANFGLLEVGV